MSHPVSTAQRTLLGGDVVRAGSESAYRHFRFGPGEAHGLRSDLILDEAMHTKNDGRTLLRFAHLTDLHIADTQSPLRLDFASRDTEGLSRWEGAVTYTHRAQELMTVHAAAAIVDTLSRLGIELAVVTGDCVDNVQYNELRNFLAVVNGEKVSPISAGGIYEGPQHEGWGDRRYWMPEGNSDEYQDRWGYPRLPGLLEAVSREFVAPGFQSAWLGCLGNHDLLVGGTTKVGEGLSAIATGAQKAVDFHRGFDFQNPLGLYLSNPEELYAGPSKTIRSDVDRRLFSPAEFAAAHVGSSKSGTSGGHGFTAENVAAGTAYYSYDPVPGIRVIVLDTNHREGYWDGSMDQRQLSWFREQLSAVSGPDAPYVIIASHHATPSINNTYGVCNDTKHSAAYATEILQSALMSPQVILWLNGHHHANRISAHYRSGGGGLFEITTASIVDSPGQARVLDVIDHGSGGVEIISTMYDADVPLIPPSDLDDFSTLASLHREIAANDRWRGGARQGLGGLPTDRNVRMFVPKTW